METAIRKTVKSTALRTLWNMAEIYEVCPGGFEPNNMKNRDIC